MTLRALSDSGADNAACNYCKLSALFMGELRVMINQIYGGAFHLHQGSNWEPFRNR